MDPSILSGRRFALILTDERQESAVFSGTLLWKGQALLFQGSNERDFAILQEWYERIKPVPPSVKSILLDAEFFLSLSVGNLPDNQDLRHFEATGLRWPQGER